MTDVSGRGNYPCESQAVNRRRRGVNNGVIVTAAAAHTTVAVAEPVADAAAAGPSWSPLDWRATWSSPQLADWSPPYRCIRAPNGAGGATGHAEAGPRPGQKALVPAGHRGLPERSTTPPRPRLRDQRGQYKSRRLPDCCVTSTEKT